MTIASNDRVDELREEVNELRRQRQFARAAEVGAQLVAIAASTENQQLARVAALEHANQLLHAGDFVAALGPLQLARAGNGPQEFHADVERKVLQAIDGLFLGEPVAGESLPENLRPAYLAVIEAFAAVERGDDDAARDLLQSIPLSSPFLEWKIFLRGLMAYHRFEDDRALENWRRLEALRLPWRLAVPFRFMIDAEFRAAQPPATRRRVLDSIESSCRPVQELRKLEKAMAKWEDRGFGKTLTLANQVLSLPEIAGTPVAEKIIRLLYHKVIRDGSLEMAEKLEKKLPRLPEDPGGHRLIALASERADILDRAADAWLAYIDEQQWPASIWPNPKLAEALVWERVAELGEHLEALPDFVPHVDIDSAECCRKSIALTPERLHPHDRLLHLLFTNPKTKKQALTAAKKVVAQFPGHVPAWMILGNSQLEAEKYVDAIASFRAAYKGDPMHEAARMLLSLALMRGGLAAATKSKSPSPDDYRPLIEESLKHAPDILRLPRLALWYIVERRLGQDEVAQDVLARASQVPETTLALPLALHLASKRDAKATPALRREMETLWNEARNRPRSNADIVHSMETLVHFVLLGVKGKSTVTTALLPKITDKVLEKFNESEIQRMARAYFALQMFPNARKVAEHAESRFPKNPWVLLLLVDIGCAARKGHAGWPERQRLEKVRSLAQSMPREAQQPLLDAIEDYQQRYRLDEGPPMEMFRILNAMLDEINDDD